MAQASLQDEWESFLETNKPSWKTLNLNDPVISLLKSSEVISQDDLEDLKAISEEQKGRRRIKFIEIIGLDIKTVKFTELVNTLRANRSATAADLFEKFSKDYAAKLSDCINKQQPKNGQLDKEKKDNIGSGSNPLQALDQLETSNSPVTTINNYTIYVSIQNLFLNSSIQWIVDDHGEEKLPKLFSAAELEASPYGTRGIFSFLSNHSPKTGYSMYINCRFDREDGGTDGDYQEWHLTEAFKDDERVKDALKSITGNEVYFEANVENMEALKSHLIAFKNGVPSNADYIIVILSSHGANDTQMFLDDMKPVDLYHHIVYELDNKIFGQVGVAKPRIYLSNMCRNLNLEAVTGALETVGEGPHITSPYYIINAGSHGETVRDTSCGSNLLQSFCDVVEKEKHLSLTELALKVEKQIQTYVAAGKQNISVDHNVIQGFNPATFRL